MQMATVSRKVTMTKVIKDTLKNEGPLAFYKGVGPPLVTVPLVNSIVFASFEFCKRTMGVLPGHDFTVAQNVIAGSFAGFVNSFAVSPIELIKCRL